MRIRKLMLLVSFGIIQKYWGGTIPYMFKILDPVMMTLNGYVITSIWGILIALSILYLLISAAFNTRRYERVLLPLIILNFGASVILDFSRIQLMSEGNRTYFLCTSAVFFATATYVLISLLRGKNKTISNQVYHNDVGAEQDIET